MAGAVLAGCGATVATSPTPAHVVITPSTASAGGALAGFLAAAADEDNTQVPVWLATPTDSTDLTELLQPGHRRAGTAGHLRCDQRGRPVEG